jgi:hypothetical protein
MFQIRAEQLEALIQIQKKRFVWELVQHARRQCLDAAADYSDEALERVAQKAIAKGKQYGIEEEDHVCRLLEWMLTHDLDFDQKFDWAQAILTNPQMQQASAKMLALSSAMIALPVAEP